MAHFTFDIFVTIDGASKFMEVVGTSIESVMADVKEMFIGEVTLCQYGRK